MNRIGTMNPEELLTVLGINDADRAECLALLADPTIDSDVARVVDALERRLGMFDEVVLDEPTQEPLVWLKAFFTLTPAVIRWHGERGIPEQITRDTLADVGLQLAVSRRVTGSFSLETWKWLTHHFTMHLFTLGRLQFSVERSPISITGVLAKGDWMLGAHIPESGPLLPALVDESVNAARDFFGRFFPDLPMNVVTCESWMFDPFLLGRVSATSNLGAFVRRFTPVGPTTDDATEALYFVFRTRDVTALDLLPRDTSLQRAVLDRFVLGETWQTGWGYFLL